MLCLALYLYTKMYTRFKVSTHSYNVAQVTIRLPTKDHLVLWPPDGPGVYILSQLMNKSFRGAPYTGSSIFSGSSDIYHDE